MALRQLGETLSVDQESFISLDVVDIGCHFERVTENKGKYSKDNAVTEGIE